MKNANKLPAIVMSIAVALAILTGSIAAPIIIRPFYYAQIDPLELERSSGLSREEIIEAYDEVLDYCIGASDEFSAGVLPFSESGSAHFADCRRLFILDLWLFFGSMAAIALLKLYRTRSCLLGRSRDRRGADRNRRGGCDELRPRLHGVPLAILPRQG